jgi:hypothetical protein
MNRESIGSMNYALFAILLDKIMRIFEMEKNPII